MGARVGGPMRLGPLVGECTAVVARDPRERLGDSPSRNASIEEEPRRDAAVLTNEPEQDVLRGDVVRLERERFAEAELEHLLASRSERDLTRRRVVPPTHDSGYLVPHVGATDPEPSQRHSCFPRVSHQPEQQVLGADVVVPETAGLLLRLYDDLTRGLTEALEHSPERIARVRRL